MVRSELLDDYLTVGDGNPKLVLVGKREVCNEPLGDVDQPFTLGSKVKTAGSMFFSHSYEILKNNLNLYILSRIRKIYKEGNLMLSYESYGRGDKDD
ncbi:hypothetical protein [Thermoplasma sp.]|uniref:hypothetical protein n=1 Tax=Thermoplasma sp. TaxID=1973142 RepID=UPI00260FD492|nr:hypothetical protein [Thermoplasma sp.]